MKNLFKRKANYNIINNSNNKIQSNSLSLNNNIANSTFYSNNNLEKNNSMYGLNYDSKNALLSPQKNQTQTNFFKRSQSHLNINNLNIKTNPHSLNSLTTLHRNNSQNKITSILNNTTYKPNYKYFSPILKNNNNKIMEKIKYNTLRLKLKRDKKDNKKNEPNNKTHFKGVESLTIKPKEIYDLFKFEEIMKIKKLNRKKDLFNRLKKDDERDEKNEYKLDIEELMEEEQEIQNIINTKEFSKLLGNKQIYKEVEYKNDKLKRLKKESNNDNNIEERKQKMDYLKQIAFEKNEESIESSIEEKSEKLKMKNNTKDPETQLRINGKIYQMKNEMDKISKELLIKYNVIKSIKRIKKIKK